MGRIAPRRVGLYFRLRLVYKWLNPPNSTMSVYNDLLARFSTSRAALNKSHLNRTTRVSRRYSRDLDRWIGRQGVGIATREKQYRDCKHYRRCTSFRRTTNTDRPAPTSSNSPDPAA